MRDSRTGLATLVCASLVTVIAGLSPPAAEARVVNLNITSRAPFVAGATFGSVGAYERLLGTATFEVDPTDAHNVVIFDLDKAPKNAAGKVTYTSQFMILKPLDTTKGNRKLFYGPLNNRGNSALTTAATLANVNTTATWLLKQVLPPTEN